MDTNLLADKLAALDIAGRNALVHNLIKTLRAGGDEASVAFVINELATMNASLLAARVEHVMKHVSPMRVEIPLGPDGAPASAEVDKLLQTAREKAIDRVPRRWKKGGLYGCYFPSSDLNVGQMGGRGTGVPKDVTWIDSIADIPWAQPGRPLVEVFAEDETKKV